MIAGRARRPDRGRQPAGLPDGCDDRAASRLLRLQGHRRPRGVDLDLRPDHPVVSARSQGCGCACDPIPARACPAAPGSALFFVVPAAWRSSRVSLMTGNSIDGFTLTWNFSIFRDAISTSTRPSSGARSSTARISTVVALVVMYPVAYWIAFHGGRHKSTLLLLLPAAVLRLVRDPDPHLAVHPRRPGDRARDAQGHRPVARETPRPLDSVRGDRRAHLRRAAVHGCCRSTSRCERIDRAHVEAAADLYASRLRAVPAGHPAAVGARASTPGILLVAITNIGDYVSAAILGGPTTTMIGNIIQTQYVQNANYPIGVGAGADPDGGAARRRCASTRGPSARERSRSTCERGAGTGDSRLARPRDRAAWTRFVLPGYVVAVIALHAGPDRGDDPLQLQPGAERPADLRLAGVHPRLVPAPVRDPRPDVGARPLARDRGAQHADRDRDRDPGGAGAGPLPVPRARRWAIW